MITARMRPQTRGTRPGFDGRPMGHLLAQALETMEAAKDEVEARAVAAHFGASDDSNRLPVVVQLEPDPPRPGEHWEEFSARSLARMKPMQERMEDLLGVSCKCLRTANSLQAPLSLEQIRGMPLPEGTRLLELDPLVQVVEMDDSIPDVGAEHLRFAHPELDGTGVVVAVLDSGVDEQHPFLVVSDSVSTCGESVELPGAHGTHCAGSIASRDVTYSGVAPASKLLNVKVLRADGRGTHSGIVDGIDAALDRGADLLSMSLGFNHLPTWSQGGHGWSCPDGQCPLCTAVNNAAALDGKLVVVAAGNEHRRAETLRFHGFGGSFDTELGCPGQAEHAITVAAVSKLTHLPADFSSHGPSSFGLAKPDLAAPGINITSTVPVPRDAKGLPDANAPRTLLFGRMSGTSMATPITAGAVALLVQRARLAGGSVSMAAIRDQLLSRCVAPLQHGPMTIGAGLLDLRGL